MNCVFIYILGFMFYRDFLFVISQLGLKRKLYLNVQDYQICISISKRKNHWTLQTKLFDAEGEIPSSIRACVSSSGFLRWQEGGAYLKLDPFSHSIFLVEEIEMPNPKFIPFRYYLNHFISIASEWKEIFHDFSQEREGVLN